ncbi:MAG TPA: phosphatidylinositol kinase [Acidimicrobiales bacterium]
MTSGGTIDVPPVPDDPLGVLEHGAVDVLGRMPWSSNATLLARVCHGDVEVLAVYKPIGGERPLRDFPPGLGRRETAAFELAEHVGWRLVPPTVLRDGPHGPGSFQLFLDADHTAHYFTVRDDPHHRRWLLRLTLFDLLSNQTDRKGGHILAGTDGRLWAIDNGLSFHVETKVRTVLWDTAGEAIPADDLGDMAGVAEGDLPDSFDDLLSEGERARLVARAASILADPVFPEPPWGDYSYPWPLV